MKSIPFSGPMVRALPIKTNTRRIINPQPKNAVKFWPNSHRLVEEGPESTVRYPPYVPGEDLYVREAWRTLATYDHLSPNELPDGVPLWFLADPEPPKGEPWGRYRHSRFMPQRFSRHTITITEVRVQRLQDISEDDAKAEGLKGITKDGKLIKYGIPDRDGLPGTDDDGWPWTDWCANAKKAYARLWESINGRGSWDANPFVWVYTFERKAAA